MHFVNGIFKEDKLSRTKVVLQYKFINEESNEEYLSRGLAVLYNFYKIKNGKCSVSNERNLKNFLTNSSNYSLEHFIINKSKKYDIGTKKPFPIQGETGKCVNSMFNFIFIPETLNKDLGNKIIYEKVDILEKRKCDIQCEFSRKVIELARIYFIGDSNKQYGILPFPSLIGLEDNEKESKLHKYLDGEDSPFFKTFFAFSSMILKEIYKKISQ